MLKKMHHFWRDQRGIVMVVTLMLMGLLSALAGTYAMMIRADTVMRGGAGRDRTGFYAAEAGLNYAMNEVRDLFSDFTPPHNYVETIAVGSGAQQRQVSYNVAEVPGRNPAPTETIPAGKQFSGMSSIPSEFTVTSTATNNAGDKEANLGAEFTIYSVPIFQFLAYYANDLEILPGPPMNLSGRIHTNGSLYLNANNTLTVGDRLVAPVNPFVQVTAHNNILRDRKDSPGTCGGTVTIDALKDTVAPLGDLDPVVMPCAGVVPAATIAAYQGSVSNGVDALQVPDVSTLERVGASVGSGVYWDKADLRIVLNLSAGRQNIAWSTVCPAGVNAPNINGSQALYPIEVQTSSGARDVALTNQLWRFMCERRGAIFYNDMPNNRPTAAITTIAVPTGASGAWPIFANNEPSNPDNYTPAFGFSNRIQATTGPTIVASGGTEAVTSAAPVAPFSGTGTNPTNLRAMVQWERAQRVYRRVGEDTNGDGIVDISGSAGTTTAAITNNDRNDDICPMPPFGAGTVAGARPWWRPDFCNQARLHLVAPGGAVASPWPAAGANVPAPGVLNTPAWYRDMDYRRGGFYNWREGRWMYLLNVNLRALIDWNEANGGPLFSPSNNSDGGLVIFLSVQASDAQNSPPTSSYRYGVRVFDSANLNTRGGTFPWPVASGGDPTGVTIASDQAVYIQGNYNFMGTGATAQKYPAAIMGDTINVLSQSWEVPSGPQTNMGTTFQNDRKTMGNLNTGGQGNRDILTTDNFLVITPNIAGLAYTIPLTLACPIGGCGAFNTTTALGINAAFLARVDNTAVGNYNGGLENYPRFHEDWGGFTLNYRGSYVSLGTPRYSSGTWSTQSYSPPDRQWDYDSQFNDPRWLPPLTPMVNMVQQRVYTRFYQ